jgi:presenilin-like A22 family membrane protease
MFLLAQIVGIFVIDAYNGEGLGERSSALTLPFGLGESGGSDIISLIFSIVLTVVIFFLLMKYDLKFIIRSWFFLVILLALTVSFNSFIPSTFVYSLIMAGILGLVFTILKIFRPSILIHNGTEVLIYPGVAAIIAPLINVTGIIILLIIIALYDAWAVWHSGIMQKMAKYQMEEARIFGGFLIPHLDKKTREKIKKLKQKYTKKELSKKFKNKKFKIRLAILGGGDVVFPIIAMGVFMRAFPLASLFGIRGLIPALFILAGSFIALVHLLLVTKKDKAYPAMPWISSGALIGMLVWWLIF